MRHWRWGAAGLVALLHLGAFVLLGQVRPEERWAAPAIPIIVDLVRPEPAPQLPEPERAASQGGGAPAAPSVVRAAPPREEPAEAPAPPVPAPEQTLIIGASPDPAPTPRPAPGLGGQGTGVGGGTGAGVGPGEGDGPPRIIRGPTIGELRQLHPREAFRRRTGGRATLVCRVRLDTTLSDCRVVDETPAGLGFGPAALAAARYFRFRPPTQNGAPLDGREVRVGVEWP